MTWAQFAIFLVTLLVGLVIIGLAIPWAVEHAIKTRWHEIREMFDRALMHGGSLDTLSKALKKAADEATVKADGALLAIEMLKGRVDVLAKQVDEISSDPVWSQLRARLRKG